MTGRQATGIQATGRQSVGRQATGRQGDKKTKFAKKNDFCPKTFVEFIESLSIKKVQAIKLAKILT